MRNILGLVHSVTLEIVGRIIYLLNVYAITAEQLWQLETTHLDLFFSFTFPLPLYHQPRKGTLIYLRRTERSLCVYLCVCLCICLSLFICSKDEFKAFVKFCCSNYSTLL